MGRTVHLTALSVLLVIVGLALFLSGCNKEEAKTAELSVSDTNYVIRQDSDHSFVIDASGTITNQGPVDVKNVVVTGYCRSCGEVLVNGRWFISDVEKTPDQKDVISYLAAGDKEEFKFKELAFFMDQSGNEPETMPEEMEVVVESYKVVE